MIELIFVIPISKTQRFAVYKLSNKYFDGGFIYCIKDQAFAGDTWFDQVLRIEVQSKDLDKFIEGLQRLQRLTTIL